MIMASKRTLEERIVIKDDEIQKLLDKANELKAQKRQLEQKKKMEERKARTHRLIVIGGAVASVLGRELVDGDELRLMNFLKQQERNGKFFSKAMNKKTPDTANNDSVDDTSSFISSIPDETGSQNAYTENA